MSEQVTIVIATYGRPNALNLTLQSVLQQSYENWKALVICDHCTEEDMDQIDDNDHRINLINLPVRCGNQYGPNSLGIYLAESTYLAFLNHDDIWLSDHLEIAINRIRAKRANFFLGTSAFCYLKGQKENYDKYGRLVFSELNRPRAIWHCLRGSNYFFEPCSSWLMHTKLAKEIGYWNSPAQVKFTPVLNWLKRASRKSTAFCFSPLISTLKFNLHHVELNRPNYSLDIFLDKVEYFVTSDDHILRQHITDDLKHVKSRGLHYREELCKPLNMREEQLFIINYVNYINGNPEIESSANIGQNNDKFLQAVRNRTGENMKAFIPAETLIEEYNRSLLSSE